MSFVTPIIEIVSGFIVSMISHLGYLGILVAMAIESACIPLPSEIIMPFAGYLVLNGKFTMLWVTIAGALGCTIGSITAYFVGKFGGRTFLEKYGKYLLIDEAEIDWADSWFKRYGNKTVFISRLLPVIRTFISLPAGIARMNFGKFVLYTFVGSLPWCWFLAYIGLKLGENWNTLGKYFHKIDVFIVAIAIVLLIIFVYYKIKKMRR